MDDDLQRLLESFRTQSQTAPTDNQEAINDVEVLEVPFYPEDQGDNAADEDEREIDALVQAAREQMSAPQQQEGAPIGYVSNARNAASYSDTFQFWAPAEEISLGIGSIVRHTSYGQQTVDTYAIVIDTEGSTLGLDDYAIHVYEQDARPPLESIHPAPSSRRPIVNYRAKVLASTHVAHRPVLSGPVYSVRADELASIHKKDCASWLAPDYLLTGFYEDAHGEFGIFAEERARVLGPKQGHVILSGLPGAGKTSLFLTLTISLYAQLRSLEEGDPNEQV
jgi:hypothetical protein